jgi:hypothetical protein
MNERNRPVEHEKFRELSALANTGTLSAEEWDELKTHLQICKSCGEAYYQYRVVESEGIPRLAARYSCPPEQIDWDDASTRERLFARVQSSKQESVEERAAPSSVSMKPVPPVRTATPLLLAWGALAACLVVGLVGLAVHRLDSGEQARTKQDLVAVQDRFQKSFAEQTSISELLTEQKKELSRLQDEISFKDQQLAEIRSQLQVAELHANESINANSKDVLLQDASKQSAALSSELHEVEQAYQNVQLELTALRGERDKALLQATTLEATIERLTAINQDRERQLEHDEQYLASDRDVRELMGARNLYIADVYDVDGRSRTQKPFGRIFYTEGKSLLFYAFDLDSRPGPKNGDTFQAWGRTDGHSEKSLNLGIFYQDSKANRRWVLRFDDPEKLAEIDSVFVTVEPNGGSRKPTGKPFLYALLRKEANHP